MSQTILLFHVSTAKVQKIRTVCRSLGISVKTVDKKDYVQKLGTLAGIVGFQKENTSGQGSELPAEMLVDSDQVDEFLKSYREAGIDPIGCKAILTPNNVFWTAEQLFQELLQEHLYFTKKS